MNREEVAWAGGLFEGEGSVGAYMRKAKPLWPQPVFCIYNSDIDVLERAQRALGLGTISARSPGRWATKTHYRLVITSWEQVQAAVAMLWPFLGERRKAQVRQTLLPMRGRGGHRRTKLSREDVTEIRRLVDTGVTQREVASMFGVSQPGICKVLKRDR